MKRIISTAITAAAALSILACGGKPTDAPGYGRVPVGKMQAPVLFNQTDEVKIPENEAVAGALVEVLPNKSAKVYIIGANAKELFESMHVNADDFAGDEQLKPEERIYAKGQTKRGDNFFCTARPLLNAEVAATEYRCQLGLDTWWGKTAGMWNPADSGANHLLWSPDASKAKVQNGYVGIGLELQALNTDGRYLGMYIVEGNDARLLYAAMGGVTAKEVKLPFYTGEGKEGEAFTCLKEQQAAGMVTYACLIGLDYQRGALVGSGQMGTFYKNAVARD